MTTPRIIVIEGTEATGTTTHTRDIAAALRAEGHTAYPFHHLPAEDPLPLQRALDYAAQRAEFASWPSDHIIVVDRWWHTAHVEALLATDDRPGLLALAQAEALLLPVPLLVAVLTADAATLDARMILRGETPTDHHTLFLAQSPKGPGFNHAAFEVAGAAAIERPDKAFFPVRPIFITGPHAIGEREEHESIEVFPVPDNAGKFLGS